MMEYTEKDAMLKYDEQTWLNLWLNLDSSQPIPEEYSFDENGVSLESFSGWGLPSPDYSTIKLAQRDGEFVSNSKAGTRDMTMNIFTDGCSREDYWATRAKLVDLLQNNAQKENTWTGVPSRYFEPSNDYGGNWFTRYAKDPVTNKYWKSEAPWDACSYSRGREGPLMWQKTINGKKYHTYPHYVSGADFSPRNLEDWHEWGIEESINLKAFDPFVYLSDVRELVFHQQGYAAPEYTITTDYFGNVAAKPWIELWDWGQKIKKPGDYVQYEISYSPVSDRAGALERSLGSETIVLKITWESILGDFYHPYLDENTRLVLNLSERGKGIYMAGRDQQIPEAPTFGQWNLFDAMHGLDTQNENYNVFSNYSNAGYGPGYSSIIVGDDIEDPNGTFRSFRFEPEKAAPYGPSITIKSNFESTDKTPITVKGALVFYETYGGI